jgi:hypothetical protein
MNDHIPDVTKMINDTPRTDAEAFYPHDSKWKVCDAEFARTLERELNAANDRIKRLEEAGDALCENSNTSRWDLPEAAARKMIDQLNWNKAKEAK